jgi:WhiB family redox-sensing transcriptional regulator
MDWRDKAACLTADPELFFPVGNTGPAVDQIDKAKAAVAAPSPRCASSTHSTPRRTRCLGWLSEDERRALAARTRAPRFSRPGFVRLRRPLNRRLR